ncbi:MAG: UDPGP type 1 family protein [Planctomycetes bacterium]|nr:UDPGP type 1 family protein [Planctomycetota bacterium]
MPSPPPTLLARLEKANQAHVLRDWGALDDAARAALVAQIEGIDFAQLDALRGAKPADALPARFAPVPVTPAAYTAEEKARGAEALRAGKVAALLVAGGQGTRLGSLQPKGLFPGAPLSGAPLYQLHAEKLFALSCRYRRAIPFLVMTSPATDAPTRAFFDENAHLHYAPDQVRVFQQATMPALCPRSGRLLLEAPGKLFLSPNGHGGALTALADCGLLADLRARGVEHVFYFQVDNPLVKVCDPGFIGRHLAHGSEASSKVVYKQDPEEKVGVLVETGGRGTIIEYTQLPRELAAERDASGALRYRAGSPAIHLFALSFLERVTRDTAAALPYRPALKCVSHYDPDTGATVAAPPPTAPNALKFERFIFDALPYAERWLTAETAREEEFAPIKNATGPDSPETSHVAQLVLYATWLARAGVETNGNLVEISPLFALDEEELAAKAKRLPPLTGPTILN